MQTTNFVLGCLLAMQVEAGETKCRALALSGGANHGAWEAGVMWGLNHYGNPEDFAWDVVTGVSAGAINTCAISVFAPGDGVAMSEFVSETWATCTSPDIWVEWPEGAAAALTSEAGVLDDSPALSFMSDAIAPYETIKRKFTVAAVNIETGQYETFNNENTSFEELPQAALSSSSIPGAFPPQHFHDMYLMDGGTVWDINVDSAIQQCLEIVEDEADIILDVMICSYSKPSAEQKTGNTVMNWLQAHQVHGSNNGSDSVKEEERKYPNVNYRYYFQDNDDCHVSNYLDFYNSTTWCL